MAKRAKDLAWLKTEFQGSSEEHFCRRIPFFLAFNIGNKNPQELKKSSIFLVSVSFSPHFLFA